MKKVIYLFLVVFGMQMSQAQIKKYKPTSYKDSFFEWLEVGVSAYQGKIADKQYIGARYSEIRGVAIDARIKIKKKLFLHGNFGYSLPSYETGFLTLGLGEYTYLTRYTMHNVNAGFGFWVFGHHKSRFAFAPIAPSFGLLRYSVKVNYLEDIPVYQVDGEVSGNQFGVGNLSTMQLRLGKTQIFTSLYLFSTLNNNNTTGTFVNGFDPKTFEPEYFYYTLQAGVRFRL